VSVQIRVRVLDCCSEDEDIVSIFLRVPIYHFLLVIVFFKCVILYSTCKCPHIMIAI